MSDLDILTDDKLLNTVVNIAHPFELDLNTIVAVNYRLTLESITKLEASEIANTQEILADDDPEDVCSTIRWRERFYADLRKGANHLALVGLVTRFQHWIKMCVEQQKIDVDDSLIPQLRALNIKLGGTGPVPVAFFQDLITARDSVIHADSSAEWSYRGDPRTVAAHYRNPSNQLEIEITEDQLKDAINKAIAQVKWYDERLTEVGSSL